MSKYPYLGFMFQVTIDSEMTDPMTGFFKSVSGLSYETEVVDYREGGVNDSTFKLVGATKWANIVLTRGFCGPAHFRNVATPGLRDVVRSCNVALLGLRAAPKKGNVLGAARRDAPRAGSLGSEEGSAPGAAGKPAGARR